VSPLAPVAAVGRAELRKSVLVTVLLVVLLAFGALALALAIAALPSRSAARTDPAFALRSE
jgi:hypothetical protein